MVEWGDGMKGDRVLEALRGLPPAHASDDFTERVLRRTDQSPRGPVRRPALRMALAAAALLAVLVPVTVRSWQARRRAEMERTRTAAFRAEYLQLERELAAINRMAERRDDVLHLGGDERVDVVLDLRALAQQAAVRTSLPASSRPHP
jgi:hypothetical protein